jgi:hypothetical protein
MKESLIEAKVVEFFLKADTNAVLPSNPNWPYFKSFAGNSAQKARSAPRWGTPKNTMALIDARR